jgi:Domain of unknown function (DUF4338)
VKYRKTPVPLVARAAAASLDEITVVPVTDLDRQRHLQKLLKKHHYLGRLKPVGERMFYAAVDGGGRWLAVLVFSAAAKHLKHRDQWIGWTRAQCDRRLSLVVNNSRFLILPQAHCPNLGSRVLRLTLDRLSADWQARYGHPVLVVETFVDPEQFNGTVYTANGWQEVGLTDGWGRCQRDFYVQHDKPKRLFVREIVKNARRSLQAEHLKPALAGVERKAGARCYHRCGELDLTGRTVALDALHTQDQTARELVLEHGAHYTMTVKNNQPTLRQNIERILPVPPTGFSPSENDTHPGTHPRKK